MKSKNKKRSYAKKDKERRGIYILPSMFTSASLFSGFYSIIAALKGDYEVAATAILISCVFDMIDGKVARLTRTTSLFGAEYDSLSDLVAFGVAPALLAYQWALEPFGRLGWLAGFMFVICGALRLARFNVQRNVSDPNYFKGLPIPGAASFIACLILFASETGCIAPESKHIFIIVLIYVLSFLMVSNVRYPSFKEFELKKQGPFNTLVSSILILIVIAYKPKVMLFFVLFLYIMCGPIITVYRFKKIRPKARKIKEDKIPATYEK